MNSEDLTQQLQKGLRIALGATTSLLEIIQDPLKRDENLSKLRLEWSELSEEWAKKGETTEQEARNLVDNFFAQQGNQTSSSTGGASSTATAPPPTTSPDIQQELQELTAQIAAIRAELEKIRNQDSAS